MHIKQKKNEKKICSPNFSPIKLNGYLSSVKSQRLGMKIFFVFYDTLVFLVVCIIVHIDNATALKQIVVVIFINHKIDIHD